MNRVVVAAGVLFGFAGCLNAEPFQPENLRLVDRGPNTDVIEWNSLVTNSSGRVVTKAHRFTRLETGLNYWQPGKNSGEKGQWVPSSEQFRVSGKGVIADKGQYQVSITSLGADIVSPEGRTISTRTLGLAYITADSSVWVAQFREVDGTLSDDLKSVVFEDAFDGLKADLRMTYGKWGFESDVILRECPPLLPSDFQLGDDVKLAVVTEFFNSVEPEVETSASRGKEDDDTLVFGALRMAQGKAFSIGNDTNATPVRKRYFNNLNGTRRNILIEEVDWSEVAPALQDLPAAPAVEAAPQPGDQPIQDAQAHPALRKHYAKLELPARRSEVAASKQIQTASASTRAGLRVASAAQPKGYVLDYVLLNNTGDFTFAGDTTYELSSTVNLYGTTVIEAGTVVKYANGASLVFNGPVSCLSRPYHPAIFTGYDDYSCGEILPGASGQPTGYYASIALDFNTGNNVITLQNVRVCNASTGIRFRGSVSNSLSHVQIGICGTAVTSTTANYGLYNALIWYTDTAFGGGNSNVHAEHLTADSLSYLSGGPSVNLTNSLLVSVYYTNNYSGGSNAITTWTGGIFNNVKAGLHYLYDNTYRGMGANTISPTLRAALSNMTTYPPSVLDDTITTTTTLAPRGLGNSGTPDLGYHYDILDYIGGPAMTAPLILTNGVSVGVINSNGIQALMGIDSSGLATALNHMARYSYVQENWANYYGSCANTVSNGVCRFRFTDFSVPSAMQGTGTTISNCYEITFRDCQFRGCNIDLAQATRSPGRRYPTVTFINNLFERSFVGVATNYPQSVVYQLSFINNTFRNTGLVFCDSFLNIGLQNNLFDQGGAFLYSSITTNISYARNIFTVGTYNGLDSDNNTLTNCIACNIVDVTVNYFDGPLGHYYFVGGNLSLGDFGDRSATDVGLYHYATPANDGIEGNSTVDIGFHYVATDGNGNPIDSNGDGIPDYLEDPNGNGVVDVGELDWTNGGAPTLSVFITDPKNNSVLP